MTIVLIDELANYTLSIFNISLFWFIWDCVLTVYVLVMVGPNSGLEILIECVYMILDKMSLLAY